MTASNAANNLEPQLPPRRSPEWYAALGFDKPFGLHTANFFEKLSFGWGAPLLEKGSYGQITEEMADCLPPSEDEAPLRAQQFADCYDQCQVRACAVWPETLFLGCLAISRNHASWASLLIMKAAIASETLLCCRRMQLQADCGS